ncbi:MAG TPA: flagellar hook-length control protein FliK [Steroidobacteraceae bacterium]|nr:flagellar hook-length control protein FliK [Steroidobacteraceae bacterium]
MASVDALKITPAPTAPAGSGANAGAAGCRDGDAAASDVAAAGEGGGAGSGAGIAGPEGVGAGAGASAPSGLAGPRCLLPGQGTSSQTPKLFSRLLSAQRAASGSTATATATTGASATAASGATPDAAAADAAATDVGGMEQPVDIATLLGELEGLKPAGATPTGAATRPAAVATKAGKDSAAKKEDEQDFEGAQSTVLDVQALLRLLEGPVSLPPKATSAEGTEGDTSLAVTSQGKSPLAALGALTAALGAAGSAGTEAGVANATAPGATATPAIAGVADPAAANAASATATALTTAAAALTASTPAAPAPDAPASSAQFTTDANGTSLLLSQTVTPAPGANGASPAVTVERSLSVPIGNRDWSPAMAAHVLWQVKAEVQTARVHLTPEGMGPVDVHIDVDGRQVSVNFTAAQVETRQALEQSVPQLRELLAGSGLTLGQTSVQQQAQQQNGSAGSANTPAQRDADHSSEQSVLPAVLSRRGLVDEYA